MNSFLASVVTTDITGESEVEQETVLSMTKPSGALVNETGDIRTKAATSGGAQFCADAQT